MTDESDDVNVEDTATVPVEELSMERPEVEVVAIGDGLEDAPPYMGERQLAFDNTSLTNLRTCARKYWFIHVEGLFPKETSAHLTFGILFHTGKEVYTGLRALGRDHEYSLRRAVRRVMKDSEGWVSSHQVKNRLTLVRSVISHCDHFKNDRLKTVMMPGGRPAVELSVRVGTGLKSPFGLDYFLAGHIDRIVEFSGQNYILDYKTTTRVLNKNYTQQFRPSSQMMQYTFLTRVATDLTIQGVFIDATSVTAKLSTHLRFPVSYRKDQIDNYFQNAAWYIRLLEHLHQTDHWPQNFSACHHYGGCPYRSICGSPDASKHIVIADGFEKRQKWDPLQVRRGEFEMENED